MTRGSSCGSCRSSALRKTRLLHCLRYAYEYHDGVGLHQQPCIMLTSYVCNARGCLLS
jgi:hypothetical protein